MGSDFFYINKGDRRVILTFLLLGVLAFVAVCLLDNDVPVEEDEQTAEWKRDDRSKKKEDLYYQVEERQVERFPFDPNTADSTQFQLSILLHGETIEAGKVFLRAIDSSRSPVLVDVTHLPRLQS